MTTLSICWSPATNSTSAFSALELQPLPSFRSLRQSAGPWRPPSRQPLQPRPQPFFWPRQSSGPCRFPSRQPLQLRPRPVFRLLEPSRKSAGPRRLHSRQPLQLRPGHIFSLLDSLLVPGVRFGAGLLEYAASCLLGVFDYDLWSF
ncbi:hypothetical protein TNCT_213271 [Trichonephila clavata]|uniref:Uncharacterized protein n=1 Tax=Trichonephila clavata TaxID=2740835 RepID=A0A8X6M274_TRICU|nr:hypothetical protein TNCT_213271 [Trichonephila clavata]